MGFCTGVGAGALARVTGGLQPLTEELTSVVAALGVTGGTVLGIRGFVREGRRDGEGAGSLGFAVGLAIVYADRVQLAASHLYQLVQ